MIIDGKQIKEKYLNKIKEEITGKKITLAVIQVGNDEASKLYVNNKIKDNTPLGRLMHDFNCSNPNDMYYPELAEKARYFKETEKGLTNMGDVFEKFVAKREKEAAMKAAEKAAKEAQANKVELAKGLLADGMSIEFTVRHSKLSEAEVRELASKLTA